MTQFAVTFAINCTETFYVDAENLEEVKNRIDNPDDKDFDFKTIVDCRYDAELVNIKQISKSEDEFLMELAVQSGICTKDSNGITYWTEQDAPKALKAFIESYEKSKK